MRHTPKETDATQTRAFSTEPLKKQKSERGRVQKGLFCIGAPLLAGPVSSCVTSAHTSRSDSSRLKPKSCPAGREAEADFSTTAQESGSRAADSGLAAF